MTSLATSTHKTMPRKINYPGYQTGGGYGDPTLDEIERQIFDLEMHMEFTPTGGARDMHPDEATELYQELDDLYRQRNDAIRARPRGRTVDEIYDYLRNHTEMGDLLADDQIMDQAIRHSQSDPRGRRLLARPKRGLLPDFSQDPELGRLRDKMGIKPTSAVMRRGFKGTGLRGLLMAGGATALNPL